MVFSVIIYGCESWTIKKSEHQRIDAFELWSWRRLFKSLLDCKEIKPVNLKRNQYWILIGRMDAEAEAPLFWPPMQRANTLENTMMLGKIVGRRRGLQSMWLLDGINGHDFEQAPGDGEGQGNLAYCSPWVTKSQIWLSNWKTTFGDKNKIVYYKL